MRITWLASYPKSGNTWVRGLLAAYTLGSLEDWRNIRTVTDEFMRRWVTSKGREDAVREGLEAFDRARASSEWAPAQMLLKSHLRFSPAHPFAGETVSAVVVVRNPRDILLSAINFAKLRRPEAEVDDRTFAARFIERGGMPAWLESGFSSWDDNVESWTGHGRFPTLLVRYEQLRAEPRETLERIVGFVGMPVDRDRIGAAVEQASLERMRGLEAAAKAAGRFFHSSKTRSFVNTGRTGQSLAGIDPSLDERFDRRFGEAMRRFGYEVGSGA